MKWFTTVEDFTDRWTCYATTLAASFFIFCSILAIKVEHEPQKELE